MADDARWYVIHTYSGYENKVADSIQKIVENRNMQDYILDVKIPTEIVTEIREDKSTHEVERKVFPGYVLVKLAVFYDEDGQPKMTDDTWYVIRNTRGCTGFVGPESKPVPLTEEEVLKLGVEKRSIEVSYEVGDTVNIMDGIMDGFSGTVQEIDLENNMVKVTVSAFFGRYTGNFTFKFSAEGKSGFCKLNGICFTYLVCRNKIKACTAAHRTEINNVVLMNAVSYISCKKMLESMNCAVFHYFFNVGTSCAYIVGYGVCINS